MNGFYFWVFEGLIIFFGIIRNTWVYSARMKVLWGPKRSAYDRLPGYATMVFYFWVWDVNKFLKDSQ